MTITQGRSSGARSVADLTYSEFYRAMTDRERLQVSRHEATWSGDGSPPDRPVEVLLNFGCNVRQTPHLQREAVAVLETLGVDLVAVAGPKYCCGKVYASQGFTDVANGIIKTSVKRMAAYESKRAFQWCVAEPEIGIEFQSEGLAALLVERLDELGERVPWKSDVTLTGLVHGHLGEHAVRDAHPGITTELIRRIPGVEIVGYAETTALDLCDNAGPKLSTIGTEEYLAVQAELESYLEESGADTLVTLYHACTRELGQFASEKLVVRHYISVLASALGVAKPDRFSEYWRLGDPVKVMEASRPNWESWGITEQEALRLAHEYFVPTYAVDAPDCPCNGSCTRTGADWLIPRVKTEEGELEHA